MCLSICFGARVEVEKSVSSRRCLPLLFWTRCEVGACGNDPQSRFRYLGLTCLACGNYSQSRTRPAKVAGRTNAFIACAEVFFSWTRLVGEWTGSPALVEQFVLDDLQFIQSQVHSREFDRKLTGKDLWPGSCHLLSKADEPC